MTHYEVIGFWPAGGSDTFRYVDRGADNFYVIERAEVHRREYWTKASDGWVQVDEEGPGNLREWENYDLYWHLYDLVVWAEAEDIQVFETSGGLWQVDVEWILPYQVPPWEEDPKILYGFLVDPKTYQVREFWREGKWKGPWRRSHHATEGQYGIEFHWSEAMLEASTTVHKP